MTPVTTKIDPRRLASRRTLSSMSAQRPRFSTRFCGHDVGEAEGLGLGTERRHVAGRCEVAAVEAAADVILQRRPAASSGSRGSSWKESSRATVRACGHARAGEVLGGIERRARQPGMEHREGLEAERGRPRGELRVGQHRHATSANRAGQAVGGGSRCGAERREGQSRRADAPMQPHQHTRTRRGPSGVGRSRHAHGRPRVPVKGRASRSGPPGVTRGGQSPRKLHRKSRLPSGGRGSA